jgi:hypothetical protein
VFELTDKKLASGEKFRDEIVAHRATPRRNSKSLLPSGIENTLITVPFSDAVATFLPVLSIATAAE